jgi:hypothetical protein
LRQCRALPATELAINYWNFSPASIENAPARSLVTPHYCLCGQ